MPLPVKSDDDIPARAKLNDTTVVSGETAIEENLQVIDRASAEIKKKRVVKDNDIGEINKNGKDNVEEEDIKETNQSLEEVREVYGTVVDDVVIVHPVHVFEYSYDSQNYEVHKFNLLMSLCH